MRSDDPLTALYAEHHGQLVAHFRSLLEEGPWDGAILASGSPAGIFGDDQEYPFRVSPRFRQWIPAGDYTDSYVVVGRRGKPGFVCHLPQDYWRASEPAPSGFWVSHFDVVCATSPDAAQRALPPRRENLAYLGDPSGCPRDFPPESINPPALIHSLDYHRVFKSDYEVECIRRANRIAVAGHLAAGSAFESGASELEIHLAYLSATGQLERRLPYPNIVALNEHGATLHYDALESAPPDRFRSMLIDAGADYLGYAADVTRTCSASAEPFRELISRVDAAQRALVAKIVAGMCFTDLHLEMHALLARVLRESDLVAMSPEAMVEEGVTSAFFPHGLGHHLGLQVHDVGGKLAAPDGRVLQQPGGHPFLRNLRPVESGNVFTIEPGIYFIPQLLEELRASRARTNVNWDRVQVFMPFGGIRIEDNIHVSASGVENLTRQAFESVGPSGR